MKELRKYKPENSDLSLQERISNLQDWLREDAQIRLRAANYYLNTELYDLTLPGYFSPHNEWIPRSDYLLYSSRYARRERGYWIEGLSAVDMEKFRIYSKDYARLSVDQLRQEVEGLNEIINK